MVQLGRMIRTVLSGRLANKLYRVDCANICWHFGDQIDLPVALPPIGSVDRSVSWAQLELMEGLFAFTALG